MSFLGDVAGGVLNTFTLGTVGGGNYAPFNGVLGTGWQPLGGGLNPWDPGAAASGAQAYYGAGGPPPPIPEFQGMNYGTPQPHYAGDPATYTPGQLGDPHLATADRSGLSAYRDFATGSGDSPWATASLDKESQNMVGARDQLARQTDSGIDQSMDRLAMNGGLSTGASERLAAGGRDAGLLARQGLESDSMKRQNDIRLQDTTARQDFLKGLPSQDLAFGNFDKNNADVINQFDTTQFGADNSANQFNASAANQNSQFNAGVGNAADQFGANMNFQEAQRRSEYDLNRYNTEAGIYGGQNMAGATLAMANANAGKGGGSSFLCTELKRLDLMTVRESKIMLEFMLRGIFRRAEFFAWYFKNGEKLIQSLRNKSTNWHQLKKLAVSDIIALIKSDLESEAQNAYIKLIESLNISRGHPMGKMPQSIYSPSAARSAFYFPLLMSRKSTWKWLKGYLGERGARSARRILRRVS